jgi:hypothetical protein
MKRFLRQWGLPIVLFLIAAVLVVVVLTGQQ